MLSICADQLVPARLHCFGPFGLLAEGGVRWVLGAGVLILDAGLSFLVNFWDYRTTGQLTSEVGCTM